jgi:hypothetical protein
MTNQDRTWLLAAVGGMLVGLSACGSSASSGEVPATVPADPAGPAGSEKNHCKSGEPHHCATEGGKHVCGAEHGVAPAASVAAGAPAEAAAADAGVSDAGGADGGAADAGSKPVPHTHTHSDGKPHKH